MGANKLKVDKIAPTDTSCVCGLPVQADSDLCIKCQGTNIIQIEGEILKKQKKGNKLKKYWYALLGKELYCKSF